MDDAIQNAEVKVIRREDLRPGDMIVVEYPYAIKPSQLKNLRDSFADLLPDHKIILLEDGARIALLGKEEVPACL